MRGLSAGESCALGEQAFSSYKVLRLWRTSIQQGKKCKKRKERRCSIPFAHCRETESDRRL